MKTIDTGLTEDEVAHHGLGIHKIHQVFPINTIDAAAAGNLLVKFHSLQRFRPSNIIVSGSVENIIELRKIVATQGAADFQVSRNMNSGKCMERTWKVWKGIK